MKIVWSAFALSDRDGIFTHIEADNPAAAIAVDDRIITAIGRLRDFPESGRTGRLAGTRELVIVGTPYVAAYQLNETTVRILRVLHGAQRWPDDLPDG
ncbi:MAG: type II toxin-antitoxin system RelE/ParE family toxin [Mesorhizobium sp.]|uniref:type II toxin-antitoxin system RelE/ParE family toxin n=1 Tax=Mesorhizobium sp. TaxID=1871066 RepID=UPI000FD2C58B|nr:type II toxin-antitoxin system RelE/ParE family toxin [Mesorhizobium sp.]RVC58420.1 type II toxin-antitoxin system RelE/ParE family toxin [Mesorhizobium sp. M4B.F.Ca.ET.088.02.2.1]RWC94500.1 MAG: type II toxin-antitoxin system RelE/ParE family toxin [Mesorhizobium sp.]RWF28361.1 MAG: type II toxin-antitoxin system RelE/ParE family toxin [Mesorhizobium sp.]RWF39657.1 MAG: type II toxin-antitoxin system RelE/ParE family toxin [Mesorhizobium sp.]TIW68016.1 MAG: type II toxin-antitoxin system R